MPTINMVSNLGPYVTYAGARAATTSTGHVTGMLGNATATLGGTFAEKLFSDVILDAKAALDAGYERFGKRLTTGTEWNDKIGLKGIHRRMLHAIASNQGGLFSFNEISVASGEMATRQSLAMMAANLTGKKPAAGSRASIAYLDVARPEEKAPLVWATLQWAYQNRMQNEDRIPDDVETGNPLVNLFIHAVEELVATNNIFGNLRKCLPTEAPWRIGRC